MKASTRLPRLTDSSRAEQTGDNRKLLGSRMHEFSIARNICRAASEHTEGRRIALIRVETGVLAGVMPDALRFCAVEVAKEMGLGEPEFVIAETPVGYKCNCGNDYELHDPLLECPECGGYEREILSGMEITIREIIEEAD